MEPQFWNDRWQSGEIGFHKTEAHDLLAKHWPRLGLAPGSEVFVPLCGKSLDMVWLAEQGHRVVGAELSDVAVDAFFAERGLEPEVEMLGGFKVKSAGPFKIWQGDIFELPLRAVKGVAAVYDRASLVAFPPEMQPRYAAKLAEIVPAAAPIVIIGLGYPQEQMQGPPFSVPLARIGDLFSRTYQITLLESRDGLEQSQNIKQRGVTALEESLYVLKWK
jgi:thiopurine S-methyltransferase